MSRIEKIAFISSFWSLLKIKDQLIQFADTDLDVLIAQITNKVKSSQTDSNALLHVFHMPIFLN